MAKSIRLNWSAGIPDYPAPEEVASVEVHRLAGPSWVRHPTSGGRIYFSPGPKEIIDIENNIVDYGPSVISVDDPQWVEYFLSDTRQFHVLSYVPRNERPETGPRQPARGPAPPRPARQQPKRRPQVTPPMAAPPPRAAPPEPLVEEGPEEDWLVEPQVEEEAEED